MVAASRIIILASSISLLLPGVTWSFAPVASRGGISRFGKLPALNNNAKVAETTIAKKVLERSDKLVFERAIRVINHVPTLCSIAYFGLISMASMMPAMNGNVGEAATLASVLTKRVGPTANQEFSRFFPTLITPPSFIFLIWPFISVVQLLTVSISALYKGEPVLSQDNLSALSVANLAATGWLLVSSRSSPGNLPLGSFLVLTLVPILSGYPLRKEQNASTPTLKTFVFQVFSSFTTIAALLALAVELQHGGRIPFFKGKAELCASIFLALYAATVTLFGRHAGIVKRFVNAGAVTGILWKRMAVCMATGGGVRGLARLSLSVSFWGTGIVSWLAIQKLFQGNEEMD